jgi:hypothetical protein
MASEFLDEVNKFIAKLIKAQSSTTSETEGAANIELEYKFNKNFSVELKHYVDEI